MPLVAIALPSGRGPAFARAIGDGVHAALVDAIGIPEDDRFQAITEHAPGMLIADPRFLGVERGSGALFVHITLRAGRTDQQKRDLYRAIVRNLADGAGVRPADVLIVLSENHLPDWSFGDGVAQYSPAES